MRGYPPFLTILFLSIAALTIAAGNSLHFDNPTLQITLKPGDTSTTVTFPFENRSESPVEVTKHASPCSCINAHFKGDKKVYQPGDSGEVEATFKVGNLYGTVKKQIVVWVKGDPPNKPSITLTAEITIPELITISPKTLNWKSGEESTPQSYKLTATTDQTIRVTQVISTNNHFGHELKTIREGWEYEIVVTPQDTKAPSFAIFRITTDSKEPRFRRVQAFANIK